MHSEGPGQANGVLSIDNRGVGTGPNSTPVRSIGSSTSTALAADSLTDAAAAFPVPDAVIGRLGLIGLEPNPNDSQGTTFTVIDNTATQIFVDPADGDMTSVAAPADSFIGVYVLDGLEITGAANVDIQDLVIIVP